MHQPVEVDAASPPPAWPDIGCKGNCGFARRGIGRQCVEGDPSCGMYLHPGDKHYAAVDAYYTALAAQESGRSTRR